MSKSHSVDRAVLSIGEILVDLIATDGVDGLADASTLAIRPGGAPANAAVALAKQGVDVAFCGVVGEDPFGRRLTRALAQRGIDVAPLRQTSDAETTLALAWQDHQGDGHFRLIRLADALLSPRDIDDADVPNRAAIVVGSVALSAQPSRSAIEYAVALAAQHDVPVCFDINVRPSLWTDFAACVAACKPILSASTLIKASLDDVGFLTEHSCRPNEAMRWLDQFGARFIALTDGARGCWYQASQADGSAESAGHHPAFPVAAVEPTGAGDAFTAAIISRLIDNDWESLAHDDIAFASAAGALTTSRHGAIDSLPSKDDVLAFLSATR